MNNRAILSLILVMGLALMSACAIKEEVARMEQDIQKETSRASDEIKQIQVPDTNGSAFSVKEGAWILSKDRMIKREKPLPDIFQKNLTLNVGESLNLTQLLSRVNDVTNLTIRVDQDLIGRLKEGEDADPLVAAHRIRYQGNLKGLLDRIASKTNTYWRHEDHQIYFYRRDTREFRLAGIPGQTNVSSQVVREGSQSRAGGGGAQATQTQGVQSSQQQRTLLSAENLSIWTAIRDGVQAMLSDEGEVVLSEAAGILTVRDHPPVLTRVESYVKRQNAALTNQVIVNVQLLSVTLNDLAELGLDWDLIVSSLDDNLLVNNTQNFALSQQENSGLISLTVPQGANDLEGSEAILRALREQGDVSIVTQASVVTLNNQPAPLQIVRETSFLAEVSTTQTVDVGVTTSLTPGKVTTGFAMTLLPHILGDGNILMQFSVNLSSLNELREVTSGNQTIQTPEIDSLDFMQRAALKEGETLVLSGFEQTETDVNESGAWYFGTGEKSRQNHQIRVLLLTPTLRSI